MGRRVLLAAVAGLALLVPASAGATDYSTAPFNITTHGYAFGQAPVFMPDGSRVLFGKDFRNGAGNQVYSVLPDGNDVRCLTCPGTGPGAVTYKENVNGVPAVQPKWPAGQAQPWVLFHSWRGHSFTLGSPGYGGFGTALWVMKPDGSDQHQISEVDVAGEAPGRHEGYDDYHAYWSPDGRQIVFAHFNGQFVWDNSNGTAKWDVRVADFVDDASGPHLSNIRVVRPDQGHWYETQWWAPDGSGFLYTETSGSTENPELFYCRLVPKGGVPDADCETHQLTSNPAWDEQAIFTPGPPNAAPTDVIFMSSRDRPGLFNTFTSVAQTFGLPNNVDNWLILPLFEAGFLQPVGQESTDLYQVHLLPGFVPGAVRRLTYDGNDGWITPEFTWDPSNRCLVWTENRFPDGYRYQLPPDVGNYTRQVNALVAHPYVPNTDTTPNGVGVAPLPVQQRTQVGAFGPGVDPAVACGAGL